MNTTPLDERLAEAGADGYLLDAASDDSNQRYLSGFDAPDPFLTLYADGRTHLLVSSLEYGRARAESRADSVERLAGYDYRERVVDQGEYDARMAVYREFLADHDVDSVLAPERFPLGSADGVRERDVGVDVDTRGVIDRMRAVKSETELEHVREAHRANEAAMATAEKLLREAAVSEGVLHLDGEALTSERVRREIEVTLLREGCALDETIVACGPDAADPHDRGSGPLRAREPVIVDIFPRSKETKYHADMTRTFAKGGASEEVREWFDLTDRARRAALDALEPGVTGAEVHDAVCDVYEDAGHPTLRSDPSTEEGFIHSTGHGVGLDVHEEPRVNPDGGELEPGHVLTIEPGLYYPGTGGVRIEDLVFVTEDGTENPTEYPISLVVE